MKAKEERLYNNLTTAKKICINQKKKEVHMKKIIGYILTLTTLISSFAFGASEIHPYDAYFQSNVYLSDDTNNALKTRIPVGNSMAVSGNNVLPATNYYTWQGSHVIETNRFISMPSFDAVGGVDTGVLIDAESGEITLRKFVLGTGWQEFVLTPTNQAGLQTNASVFTVGAAGDSNSGLFLQSITAGAGVYNAMWANGANADVSSVQIGASPYADGDTWEFYKTYLNCYGKSISNATFNGTHVGDGSALTNLPAQTIGGSLSSNLDGASFSITNTTSISAYGDFTVTAEETDGTGTNADIIVHALYGSFKINLEDNEAHYVIINTLPSSDPGVLNALWKSGSNVYISTGP